MTATPKTQAGMLTEEIMRSLHTKGLIKEGNYNLTWSAVNMVLDDHFKIVARSGLSHGEIMAEELGITKMPGWLRKTLRGG